MSTPPTTPKASPKPPALLQTPQRVRQRRSSPNDKKSDAAAEVVKPWLPHWKKPWWWNCALSILTRPIVLILLAVGAVSIITCAAKGATTSGAAPGTASTSGSKPSGGSYITSWRNEGASAWASLTASYSFDLKPGPDPASPELSPPRNKTGTRPQAARFWGTTPRTSTAWCPSGR